MKEVPGELFIEVSGDDLIQLLNESGGHRIQRVPPTEKKGRVHTSTVTVAVMPTSNQKELQIEKKDLKIEWYSGSGAGGQHRNKHQNSVRLTHIPTNITVSSQCRSRENSLSTAMETLVERLRRETQYKIYKEETQDRKNKVGSGMRGDKKRTYRFQDDIVTDHDTDIKASVSIVLKGYFDLLW